MFRFIYGRASDRRIKKLRDNGYEIKKVRLSDGSLIILKRYKTLQNEFNNILE